MYYVQYIRVLYYYRYTTYMHIPSQFPFSSHIIYWKWHAIYSIHKNEVTHIWHFHRKLKQKAQHSNTHMHIIIYYSLIGTGCLLGSYYYTYIHTYLFFCYVFHESYVNWNVPHPYIWNKTYKHIGKKENSSHLS